MVGGAALFISNAAHAVCDNHDPTTGQTATCNTSPPNPDNMRVQAAAGSTNVTVNILPGAGINVATANGVLVRDQSQVINSGAITVTGNTFDGITSDLTGNNNILINRGTITTTGTFSEGIFTTGLSSMLLNDTGGMIITQGNDSPGLHSFGGPGNNILTNTGMITTSGDRSSGLQAISPGNVLTNNGSVTTTGAGAHGLFGSGDNNTLINNGAINVSGLNAHGITSLGTTLGPITNAGSITASGPGGLGAFIESATTFTNTAGATIASQQASGIIANGGGTFNNAGTISGQNIGININGGAGNVTNTGTIIGTIGAGLLFAGNFNNSVFNSGNISGGNGTAIQFDTGNDTMTWTGGTIAGAIAFGSGNDALTLRNLTDTNLAATTRIDGGLGNDRLTFDNSSASGVERFVNWELIELTNRSQLNFNNNTLVLGDIGTGTGALTIDATSSILAAGTNTIAPMTAGQLVTVTNAGTIDLTNARTPATSSLTIVGNYVGAGGLLDVRTVIGGDGSPSDKLIISTGSGSGSTAIGVINAGGTGAPTVGDGIMLVQAINGASTTPSAFSLAVPVTAGAFDYFLFKGGVSPGSQDSWFLRSSLVAGPTPAPGTPLLPTPVPGAPPIPLFQPDVAVQSVIPAVARTLGLVMLGSFNEREGDQLLLRGDTRVGAWGRAFGQQTRENFAEGARPDFDGAFAGFQTGADLWRWESINGHTDRIGFYIGQARASGAVHGLVDASDGVLAGHVDLDATSYGGYWTHLGRSNWYVDAVLQGTRFQTSTNSIRGDNTSFGGNGFAASLEAGYPVMLAPWLKFEPQIQGLWQRVSFDNTLVPFSTVTFDRTDVFTGRAGALLRGIFGRTGGQWQPYLKGNVWWGSNGLDTITFNGVGIPTGRNGGIRLEGGGGVTGKLTRYVSIYADASYLSSVSGETSITVKGNAGMRVTW